MKKLLSLLVAALMILALVTGCTPSDPGTDPAAGKTVVIGGLSDLVTLDPGHMYEPYANMMFPAFYDTLYKVEPGTLGNPVPSIATSFTVDETGTVYTFPMKDNVTFASGNPMTAYDVEWSVKRLMNMKDSNAYPTVEVVESVVAADEYTVVFTLKEADASFLAKLTFNAYGILDSKLVKEHGGSDGTDGAADAAQTWLDENSAGSGPFVLESWTPKQELTMVKNAGYWGEAKNIDKVIFREIPTVDAQIAALKTGEIDIAMGLNGETAKQLEGEANITIANGPTALITFLVMSRNPELSPELSNPKVQEAVRYALDYEGYVALSGEGSTVPLNFVQQGFSGALNRDLATDGRDLEKAKALLTEAGYPEGFTVTLTCGNNNSEGLEWSTIAQKVSSDLAEVGITVVIESLEATIVYERMREGTMPFYVMFWSPDYYDINNQFAFLPGMANESSEGTAYGNRCAWDLSPENQKLMDLAAQIRVETDPHVRDALSEELQMEYAKDNPLAFLLQHPKVYAYNSANLAHVSYNDLNKIEIIELVAN